MAPSAVSASSRSSWPSRASPWPGPRRRTCSGSNRDVTTTSEQALRLYHEGVENDLKMYEREAMSSYAEALRYDPHFVMATLRLADKMRARDPERAKSLLMSASGDRDSLTAREQLILSIYEERWGARRHEALESLVRRVRPPVSEGPGGLSDASGLPRERGPDARGDRGVRASHRR